MEPTPNELKNAAASTGQYVGDKAKQMANTVSEKLHKSEIRAEEMYHTAKERADEALDTSAEFVKKHPISTVAGAAAIGFIAGVLMRGPRH